MFRATFKSLLSRKLRLTLSAFAVLLGVMFVSGAFVLTDSLGKSFDNLFASINTSIDVQVTPEQKVDAGDSTVVTTPIPASALAKVEAVPGVAKATGGVFAEGARVIGKNGKVAGGFAPRFGSNWPGEDDLIEVREGRGPTAPDEIAMDAALAKSTGYRVGDTVGVLTLEPKKTFTLVGIFGYSGNRDTLGGSQVVAFTLPVAQELMLGETDVYTQIDVQAEPGVSQAALRDDVRAALGSGYEVRTQAEVNEANSADIREGLAFFNYILLGFAGVALFVGIFLILNTFSMLVAQRTRELALLRAIGASRGQVINSVLLEATVIGVLAAVLGLAAGIGVGALLAYLFGNSGGSNIDLAVSVPLTAVVAAFVVGLGVTLIAALMPAIRASRIPPIAAMRDAATPDKPLTRITVIGGVVLAIGAGLMAWALLGDAGDATLWALLGGVLVAFIGVALLTPIISRPVVSLLGRLFAWSVPGKLGRQNSARNPRRTAVTAAALMVSIALITGISTVLASATKSISGVLEKQVKADLIVSGVQTGPLPPTFDGAVVEQIQGLPDVSAVAAFSFDYGLIDGRQDFLVAVNDIGATQRILGLQADSGEVSQLSGDEVILNKSLAEDRNLSVGDTISVQTSRGAPVTYTVSGIYEDNDAAGGFVFPASTAERFRTDQPAQAYIQLDSGADVGAVESRVEALLADSPEVTVQDRSAYIDQTTGLFNQVLTFIQILLALAILIAVLGIVNTLALSVIERTRELGLLRAIGLRRSQTMRMITVESVVISVFGALLGIVVGIGLGLAVVQALRDEGFTEFALPWTQMAVYLVLAAIVGVVAAVLPAIRAARLNVLNAIAYE